MKENKKDPRSIALTAVISLPIIWGTTFSVVQRSLLDISPVAFALIRFGFSSLVFIVFSDSARRAMRLLVLPKTPAERRFRRDMLVLGATLGLGYILQNIGLMTTTTSKSAFLTSTTVIWTPMLAILMGRERLHANVAVAVIITVAGILLMTHPFGASGVVIGDVLSTACAMSFGLFIIWIDRSMLDTLEIARDEHDASMMVTSSMLVTSSLFFLLCLPIETPRVHFTTFAIEALLYTGLVSTVLTAYLQTRYQNHVSPTVAAIIYMLEPVVAMAVAAIFLTEHMGVPEMIGGVLIIVGVIVAQIKFSSKAEAEHPAPHTPSILP